MSADQKDSWKRNPLAGIRSADPVLPVDSTALPTQSGNGARSVLETISGPAKEQRERAWEKSNRAFSYVVPTPLRNLAIQLRRDILSITQFDQDGKPRADRTTVDQVAGILMDWALNEIRLNPKLLVPRPNPRSRKGQMTVTWEAWEGREKTTVNLKEPLRRSGKKANEKPCSLSFRWGLETDQRIKELAGVGAISESKKNPNKFAIPVGEVVVSLLQLAVKGYQARRFTLRIAAKTSTKVEGWSHS